MAEIISTGYFLSCSCCSNRIVNSKGEFTGYFVNLCSGIIMDSQGRDTGYSVSGIDFGRIIGKHGNDTGFFVGGKSGSEILGPSAKLPFMK
jgi:hypothetical protein